MNEKWQTLLDKADSIQQDQIIYVLAQLTDQILTGKWEKQKPFLEQNLSKLLDLRVFCEERELHLFRAAISEGFFLRDSYELENNMKNRIREEYPDSDIEQVFQRDYLMREEQFLETDTGRFYGIKKRLGFDAPQEYRKIRIINYLAYRKNGQCYVKDFRLAGLLK